MPTSSNSGKAWIGEQLKRINSRFNISSVLDIGAGEGTYLNKYKSILPDSVWTGVEVWEDYISKYNLTKIYDNLINEDCRMVNYKKIGPFDIAFAGDVLEHMHKTESETIVKKLLNNSRCLIISIPVVYMPQGAHEGNPYEEHIKNDWSDAEVKSTFGEHIIKSYVDNEIGVYLLSKDADFIKTYNKIKIAIYTICKNEQHHVDRWASSNTEADIRLVCDTGSTDNTIDLLKKHNVEVIPIRVMPWRFDVARNTVLNLLPQDVDVCIWQDLDEELLTGWRQELEKVWNYNITCLNHRYRNNNNPWQWHSKIHARHNCYWTGAVHETLKWTIPEKEEYAPEIYLDEHQDKGKDRSNYFDLLLRKVEEGDTNWRTYYFLANEYQYKNDLPNAINTRIKSYDLCNDGNVVLSYIAKNIAKNYSYLSDVKNARDWFHISLADSYERETWFSLTEFYYNQKEWEQCYVSASRCLSITQLRNGFTYDGEAWSYIIYDYAAIAAYNSGLYKQAYEYGLEAIRLNPNDDRLKRNLEFYEENVQIPLPEVLEIETSASCNRTCGACIRNSHPDREKISKWFDNSVLPLETIKIIFEQAKALGYNKDLGLSHYNEPLQDSRLVDILKLAKTYPFRNIFFHSNGDLLTKELAESIDGLPNWIVFSIYAVGDAKKEREEQISSWFKTTQVRFTSGKLGLTHFGPTKHLDSIIESVIDLPCGEPRERFIINHLGEMEFCCDDLGGNFDLGSVSETNTLSDLWFNPRFQRMIKQVARSGGRRSLSYCETCPRPHHQEFQAKNIKVVTNAKS